MVSMHSVALLRLRKWKTLQVVKKCMLLAVQLVLDMAMPAAPGTARLLVSESGQDARSHRGFGARPQIRSRKCLSQDLCTVLIP